MIAQLTPTMRIMILRKLFDFKKNMNDLHILDKEQKQNRLPRLNAFRIMLIQSHDDSCRQRKVETLATTVIMYEYFSI